MFYVSIQNDDFMSCKRSKIKAAIRSLKLHDDCFVARMLPYRFIDEESRVGLDDKWGYCSVRTL